MITYTQEQLAEIIESHRKWLDDEDGGERADLSGAYLRGADLSDADLSGADLSGADLSGADLSDADLSGADLCGADLSGAYLSGAYLRGAYLRGANLRDLRSMRGASGNCAEIKAIQCDLWPVTYTATHMQIGCQLHALAEWWEFSDDEISLMASKALDWWRVWKPILAKIIEVSPAVPGATEEESHDAD